MPSARMEGFEIGTLLIDVLNGLWHMNECCLVSAKSFDQKDLTVLNWCETVFLLFEYTVIWSLFLLHVKFKNFSSKNNCSNKIYFDLSRV